MKKLRIFLANLGLRSPLFQLTTPPMGLLYLAAYVRDRFPVEIKIVNQRLEGCSNEALAQMALEYNGDITGFGCITPASHGLPAVVKAVRAGAPDMKIIIGGPHVSACGHSLLESLPADAAFIGEGEISLSMYLDVLQGNGSLEDIPGLAWRNEAGEVITNPGVSPIVENLDDLPMPAYDLIDLPRYWRVQSVAPIPRRRYFSMVTSRGCPYGCTWCHNIFGRKFRFHTPERVVAELSRFTQEYNINDVEFIDDCYNLRRERVLEIADLIAQKNLKLKIAFPNGVRADLIDETMMDALSQSGIYFCSFALDSASPRIQKLTHKNLDLDKFLHAVELASAKRVFTNGFMMLGFPEETEEEMQATISMATNSRLHTASFYTVTPFPGTPLFDYARIHYPDRLQILDYSNMDFCTMRTNISAVPDKTLYYFQRKANRNFFLKPNRLYRILRDYPQPQLLPLYLPIVLDRMSKGLFH
ncbi:MAG: B12-binding domain-containing radical SAM protein [Candidatus Hydrogenedentes bacterium]|nr:B12-binding domain-containing radical SAM protein [Candidatus Hydrogenedentota bacterium]